jgi:hypothetical protein
MANTTNIDHIEWDGVRGAIHFNLSSDSTALTAFSILDLSADLAPAPAAVKIRTIQLTMYGNFILTLLINADSNETMFVAEGQTVDASFEMVRDFTDFPGGAWHADDGAAGFLGDLLLTSSGLANADGFDLVVTFEKD